MDRVSLGFGDIFASVSEFNSFIMVHVRKYFHDRPTKNGIALTTKEWYQLMDKAGEINKQLADIEEFEHFSIPAVIELNSEQQNFAVRKIILCLSLFVCFSLAEAKKIGFCGDDSWSSKMTYIPKPRFTIKKKVRKNFIIGEGGETVFRLIRRRDEYPRLVTAYPIKEDSKREAKKPEEEQENDQEQETENEQEYEQQQQSQEEEEPEEWDVD
ncbi:hypothetical protein AC249_AIPGENE3762 [Exaiptasia diaphana]|nr:hypothetical protein AC249_AIPGENE3762 [Exaiptasia diaphana]